ncbi:uncharacterized protein LOC143202668 [Rhynchophorus ferrugineus]|uniref:uncharacterized protein LOC143202668 n=1 Tax=Rhynchophorus ferrugineus TaxID=354439 RepID=UPI003FCEC6E3
MAAVGERTIHGISYDLLCRSRKVCNHFIDEDYRPKCGKPWLKQDIIPTSNLNTFSLPLLQDKEHMPPMAILNHISFLRLIDIDEILLHQQDPEINNSACPISFVSDWMKN